jgi:hypothetical protein
MVESKVMAIFNRYLSLADQTSSSPCSDYIENLRKTTVIKFWALSNGCIKIYGNFNPLLKFGWLDLLVTMVQFHSNPKENGFQKLVQNIKRDPMVGSKVMSILTPYLSLVAKTSSSPSWDSYQPQWKRFQETRVKI